MKSKEEEFRELFLAEAQENQQELDKLFTELEKNHDSRKAIDAIFRITHTLKANAAGMGFDDIAAMAHTLEDVFSEIKQQRISITTELFNDLFRANDVLGALITGIAHPTKAKVKFRGIKTKLEVLLRNSRSVDAETPPAEKPTNPLSGDAPGMLAGLVSHAETGKRVLVAAATETAVLEPEADENLGNPEEPNTIALSDNIHIPVRKLDELLNLVGELIIEKDRVIALHAESGRRANDFNRLQRITSELQYSIMDVRLVQVALLFNKFHRIVRDVANVESKQVHLVLAGTDIEIDRNILQTISDSLIHLVRNAISHGIEPEADRIHANKPAAGTLHLAAHSEKEEVIIEVTDDGRGMDPDRIRRKALEKQLITPELARTMQADEVIQLIFEPGFSSADQVTAISGRGVGMDVVKKAIDSIGGKISIHSVVGQGTTIRLTLPSSMALKNALLFELDVNTFAIPLVYTEAVVSLYKRDIRKAGNGLLARHLDHTIGIVFLNDLFALESVRMPMKDGLLHRTYDTLPDEKKVDIIVIAYAGYRVGFVVDKLFQQKEIVEKPLGHFFDDVKFISGATILGKGNVCLVLDAPSIMNFLFRNSKITACAATIPTHDFNAARTGYYP